MDENGHPRMPTVVVFRAWTTPRRRPRRRSPTRVRCPGRSPNPGTWTLTVDRYGSLDTRESPAEPGRSEVGYSAPGLVPGQDHAVGKRPGLHQGQVHPVVQGREERRAAAHQDRCGDQHVLVDQPGPYGLRGECGAADVHGAA